MSFGGGGGGDTKTEIRYAQYLEKHHREFLNDMEVMCDAAIANNPFTVSIAQLDGSKIDPDAAFLGIGYTMGDYPSDMDLFGKFVAGLDLETLFSQVYANTLDADLIRDIIAAESAYLDDEINTTILPRFQAGMRNINAVQSSAFVVGKSNIEATKIKAMAKFDADVRFRTVEVAVRKWERHLEWNSKVPAAYLDHIKTYYSLKLDTESYMNDLREKEALWPLTVFDNKRAFIAALQGAQSSVSGKAKMSTGSRLAQAALNGVSTFAMTGGNPFMTAAAVGVSLLNG